MMFMNNSAETSVEELAAVLARIDEDLAPKGFYALSYQELAERIQACLVSPPTVPADFSRGEVWDW